MSNGLALDIGVRADGGLLDGIVGRLKQPTPLLKLMADEIRDYEGKVFASRGFGAWPALDPVTSAEKHGGALLVDTGGLLRSLTRYPAPNAVERIAGDSVTVATDDVAAIMHQHGRHVPKRNPAPAPSRAVVAGWAQTLLDALLDGAV